MKKKRSPKVLQMPTPQGKVQPEAPLKPLTEAAWEQIADEIFAERKSDVGRAPDRRRPPIPTWRPPSS